MRSAVGHQHTLKLQHKCQPRPIAESLHIISLTHSYGKENRREHCRRFARSDFCRSCLQLMTSRNTAVFLRRYIIVGYFLLPRIPRPRYNNVSVFDILVWIIKTKLLSVSLRCKSWRLKTGNIISKSYSQIQRPGASRHIYQPTFLLHFYA